MHIPQSSSPCSLSPSTSVGHEIKSCTGVGTPFAWSPPYSPPPNLSCGGSHPVCGYPPHTASPTYRQADPPTIPKQPPQSHMAALQCKATKFCNAPPPCNVGIHVVNPHVRPQGLPPSQVTVPCPHGHLALQQGTLFCTTKKVVLPGHLGPGSKRLPQLRAQINPWPAPPLTVPDHRCSQLQQWPIEEYLGRVRPPWCRGF